MLWIYRNSHKWHITPCIFQLLIKGFILCCIILQYYNLLFLFHIMTLRFIHVALISPISLLYTAVTLYKSHNVFYPFFCKWTFMLLPVFHSNKYKYLNKHSCNTSWALGVLLGLPLWASSTQWDIFQLSSKVDKLSSLNMPSGDSSWWSTFTNTWLCQTLQFLPIWWIWNRILLFSFARSLVRLSAYSSVNQTFSFLFFWWTIV